jgi:hypothetical protein
MTPIFQYVAGSDAAKALIGFEPVRFWPFAEAPQPTDDLYGLPYAVWQIVYGNPQNYLSGEPDADNVGIQVDAWARTPEEARQVRDALRYALEPFGVVTTYNPDDRDRATGLYRGSFTIEFWSDR